MTVEHMPDWRCTSCGQDIDGNPRFCPRCGYTVYEPVGAMGGRERAEREQPDDQLEEGAS